MKHFILALSLLIWLVQPVFAEDWFQINDTWKADRDTIIKTKKYYTVWLHNIKNGTYYYNQYKTDAPEKLIRQTQIGNNEPTHYPNGKEFGELDKDDVLIIKAISDPSYTYVKPQHKENLTCLELKYTVSSRNHSVDKLEYFYINTADNIVLDNNKNHVASVEEFSDKTIKFITKHPANDTIYDIVTTYTIDRYTGSVHTLQQSCPRTKLAKFDRALTMGIYDLTIGEGTGTVNKVEKTKQRF